MGICFGLAFFIMLFDSRFYTSFWYVFYIGSLVLLILVLVIGQTVDGNRSWFEVGPIKFQPSEFAKVTTALALAKIISTTHFSFEPTSKSRSFIRRFENIPVLNGTVDGVKAFAILMIPAILILLENDTGSTLVYMSFVLAFFRFGLSWLYFVTGVLMGVVFFLEILFPIQYVLTGLLVLGVLVSIFVTDVRNGWKAAALMVAFFIMALLLPGMFAGFLPPCTIDPAIKDPVLCAGYPSWMPAVLPPVLPALFSVTVMMVFAFVCFIFRKAIGGAGTFLAIFIFLVSFALMAKPIYNNVLKPHHRTRIMVLLGKETDRRGAAWNVYNSKVAIGSGGVLGKGYLKGSFTKLKFIPKQRTDFIFSTVGEEWGFWGSSLVLIIYLAFLIRLVLAADRQRNKFHMVYGYCVACLMFFHYFMNVGTTIGLAPAVGVPLPFFSYGGSSLLGFTILLWIFIKMDSQNMQILR